MLLAKIPHIVVLTEYSFKKIIKKYCIMNSKWPVFFLSSSETQINPFTFPLKFSTLTWSQYDLQRFTYKIKNPVDNKKYVQQQTKKIK